MAEVLEGNSVDKPFRIEVTKNTKGYNWSVRVTGDDMDTVKENLKSLETWANENYGNKE